MFNHKKSTTEHYWHNFFEYAILIKGFLGIWETLIGFLFLFTSKAEFNNIFVFLAGSELSEKPRDFFIVIISQALQNFSFDIRIFIAIYLVLHGLLDIFLVIQLYRNKLWAYMFSIIVLTFFVVYQIYHMFVYHSFFLIIFTLFDLLLIILIWHERKRKKSEIKENV